MAGRIAFRHLPECRHASEAAVSKRVQVSVSAEVKAELVRIQAEIKAERGVTVSLAEILRSKVLARPEPERTP